MRARLAGAPPRALRPVERRSILRSTERSAARMRIQRAKEDLVLEAALAWFEGTASEADLKDAIGDLKRARAR